MNLCASGSVGAEPPAVPLWPDGALEVGSEAVEETVKNRSYDQNAYGLNRSISQVTVPTVAFHLPSEETATGAAVVICPGGGFRRIVIDKEGHDVARWLNQKGIAGIVLKYRTCEPGAAESLADVQRAVRLVRSRAEELRVKPDRIGVMGFSAGGYMAIRAATEILPGNPKAAGSLERVSSKPDFFAPIYPAVPKNIDQLITSNTPPAFLVYTHDDGVPRSGGVELYEALGRAGVRAELHIYAKGGHGYGLGIHGGAVAAWPEVFHNWLKTMGAVSSGPAVSADAAADTPGTEFPDPMDDMRMPWEFSPEMVVLTNWLVCGEFPNPPHAGDERYDHTPPCVGLETDYLKEHGGEAAIVPVEGMTHTRPDGTKAVWAGHSMEHYGVDFRKFPGIRPAQNRVAYAHTTLDWIEAGEAVLALGSDDGVRVWVNGELVHDHVVEREGTMDADIVPVTLKKGKNRVLVKVESAGGSWYFKMRVAAIPEMRAQATLYTKPRPEVVRRSEAADDVLEIDTDAALYQRALPVETALVEVLAPGGECIAKEEVPRGQVVRFDTTRWARGPYDVRVSWTDGAGRRTCHYLPSYTGDWRAKVIEILNACDRVDPKSRSRKDLRLRLVKDFILFGLKGDPREGDISKLKDHAWQWIHFALMEYEEILIGLEAGRPAKVFHRLTWIEDLDDSPQFCRIHLPREYDGKKRFPMVVDLHGMNTHKRNYAEWWHERHRYGKIAAAYPVIELSPHGRGNSGYRGLGERDVMKAIQLAQETFLVDPDRIYLMGHSMGAGGTWHLGSRHPHLFAALAPIYGSGDYHAWTEPEEFAKMTPLSRFFHEAGACPSHAEALLTTPVFIAQGDSDSRYFVRSSRYAARLLQRWGYDVRYWEVPGWGHHPLPKEYQVLEWLLQRKLNRNPHEIRIRANRLSSSSVHWVEVQQREHPFEFVTVNARVLNPTTVACESDNALQIKLTPGPQLVDHGKPLSVIWNGRFIGRKAFTNGTVVVRQPGYQPSKGEKNAVIEGPLDDRHNLPFAIVCGTASADPGMRRVCRLKAETARDSWRHEWNHLPRYFLDTEVTDEIVRKYSLELYGGPEANLVTRKLIDQLPFGIDGDNVTIDTRTFNARDSAVGVICPNPMNPERYVSLFAGTSLRGMYLCNRVEQGFDYCVTDVGKLAEEETKWGDLNIVMGSFDHQWKYEPEYAVEGNPGLRARASLIGGPSIGSAKVDADLLYLSDLLETRALGTFAEMRRDTNWDYLPIRLGDKTHAKGIGVQALRQTSLVEYDIAGGGWSRLKSTIGIEMNDPSILKPGRKDKTSVYFVVLGDGKELYRSPMFEKNVPPEEIDIDVAGVKTLRLEVARKYQLGYLGSSVNWADLRMEK